MNDRQYFVYRIYDASGHLLYVGCSKRPYLRWWEGHSRQPWASDAARFRLAGPYPRDVAQRLERAAIRDETPRWNIVRYLRGAGTPPRNVPRFLNHDPQAVRAALRAAGLSQSELAAAIYKSPGLVSEILRGTRSATPKTLRSIAAVLGCPVAALEAKQAVS